MKEIRILDPQNHLKFIATEYRAERPMHMGGKKIEEMYEEGIRYYLVDDDKWFDADTYDKMFNPPKEKILKKGEQMPLKGLWNARVIARGPNEKYIKRVAMLKYKHKIA